MDAPVQKRTVLESAGARITRLAPSPTGALHLGNARTFLINWALARTLGWKIVLRIEDLDTPRTKPGATQGIVETLAWLGMDWDADDAHAGGVLVQSVDLQPYREAMGRLAERGMAYPCQLSRADVEAAASAPQEGARESPFPASLRPAEAGSPLDFDAVQRAWMARHGGVGRDAASTNWRVACPTGTWRFEDQIAGAQAFDVGAIAGDFVLWTKRDQPSYQLAVVVDDERQGVTDVVRGADLLDSAARQMMLREALGFRREPTYWHLPLVVGADGKRLAKRHGDSRVETYRAQRVPAEAIVGLIGYWSIPGLGRGCMTADEFAARYDSRSMSRKPVVFSHEDERWLLSQS